MHLKKRRIIYLSFALLIIFAGIYRGQKKFKSQKAPAHQVEKTLPPEQSLAKEPVKSESNSLQKNSVKGPENVSVNKPVQEAVNSVSGIPPKPRVIGKWSGKTHSPALLHFKALEKLAPMETRDTLREETDSVVSTRLVFDSLKTRQTLILEKSTSRSTGRESGHTLKSAGRILVGVREENSQDLFKELRAKGFSVTEIRPGTLVITLDSPTLSQYQQITETLRQNPDVRNAEGDYLRYTSAFGNDPYSGLLHGMKDINDIDIDADEAWSYATDCSPIQVGIIDTGADSDHPDLRENLLAEKAWNFSDSKNEAGAEDDQYHGTHVAGTIGAAGNNATGVAGVCWKVKMVPVKVLDFQGSGFTSDIIRGIQYLTNATDVKIINASLGGPGFSSEMFNAVSAFTAVKGGIFVAAAGNDGLDIDDPVNRTYPASYDIRGLVTVAALRQSQNGLAEFSNFGQSVDIAAPGSAIFSTIPTEYLVDAPGYFALDGTSMATPHIAGMLALAWSQKPSASAAEIIAALYATSDTFDNLKPVAGAKKANLRKLLEQIMEVDRHLATSWERFMGEAITDEKTGELKTNIRGGVYSWDTWEETFLNSEEFSQRMNQTYGDMISTVENPHLKTWREKIKEGASLNELKKELAGSDEFTENYQQRIARVTGLSSHAIESRDKWSEALLSGGNIKDLEEGLISSVYTDQAYRDLFREIFQSDIKEESLLKIKERLKDPLVSFASIRKEFAGSPATLLRINQTFNELTKRDASSEELTTLRQHVGENHLLSSLREKIKSMAGIASD